MLFSRTSTMKTSLHVREDSDGKSWVQAIRAAGAVAKTPYAIVVNEFGYVAEALADSTKQYYVGVPEGAVASGAVGWFQIGGEIEDMITPSLSMSVGHAMRVHDGAIADVGADYSGGSSEFAVATKETTSSTTQDAILVPRIITGTT